MGSYTDNNIPHTTINIVQQFHKFLDNATHDFPT